MNKIFLIGRLVADPSLKFTPGSGVAVTSFRIAVDRKFTGQNGEKQVDYISIVCWNKLAEHVTNNLNKGRLVAISGSIRTRNYDKDGHKVYVTEIYADEVKFLDWPKGNSELSNAEHDDFYPVSDEEIPF